VLPMNRLFDVDGIGDPKPRVTEGEVRDVFDYWVRTHNARGAHLSKLRRRRIHDAIRDYGLAVCFAAVDGCRRSAWHMGDNPRGQRYNDVSLILRDAGHIERFSALAEGDELDSWLRDQG
jgi:hypothetical protein